MDTYAPLTLEKKWQQQWAAQQAEAGKDSGAAEALGNTVKNPYYVLEMMPYPSGRLHMGHARNYALGDLIARFKRKQGFDVLHPPSWDAFGLPAENAAIKHKVSPKVWTEKNIAAMRDQLKRLAISYDWDHEVSTCDVDYYAQQQKLFLALYKKGLVYQKESSVNWDPVEQTVLANEQVVDGKGWRSGAPVEKKKLKQWFFKISAYAEELLADLDGLTEWPEKVRTMQEKWIGKSTGALIQFPVVGVDQSIEVYTTRPDTLFGGTFMGLAAEHPLAMEAAKNNTAVAAFVKKCAKQDTSQKTLDTMEKEGVDTGLRVMNPFSKKEMPVYVVNYVLMDYGTGAVYGCPAHDERDYVFARKYDLAIQPVVSGPEGAAQELPYVGPGTLINSDFLDGLSVEEGIKAALVRLEEYGCGQAQTTYRLRDWGVSRQRYWGCPIPMVQCEACGVIPETRLPVQLPEDVVLEKAGNPLVDHPTWKHVTCPKCDSPAVRETDTLDTFVDSSWYFLRLVNPKAEMPLDAAAIKNWLPVNQYIGGIEHAVMHLLYARFMTKALRDCGLIELSEPFQKLMTQGMVCHETYRNSQGDWLSPEEIETVDGRIVEKATGQDVQLGSAEKMSKSKLNVVDPEGIINAYGADAARLFVLSDSPPDKDFDWTETGIHGAWKYLNRLWRMCLETGNAEAVNADTDMQQLSAIHETIRDVTRHFDQFHVNKGIARIRELTNQLSQNQPEISPETYRFGCEVALQLLFPMVPHITSELWQRLGFDGELASVPWPVADEKMIVKTSVCYAVQINGKVRAKIDMDPSLDQELLIAQVKDHEMVKKHLENKAIRKTIVVPNKVISFVV